MSVTAHAIAEFSDGHVAEPSCFEVMGAAREVVRRVKNELPDHFPDPDGTYADAISQMVEHFVKTNNPSGVLLTVTAGNGESTTDPQETEKDSAIRLSDSHGGSLFVSITAVEGIDNHSQIDLILRRLHVIMGQLQGIDKGEHIKMLGDQRAKLSGLVRTTQTHAAKLKKLLQEARKNPDAINSKAIATAMNGMQQSLKNIMRISGLPNKERSMVDGIMQRLQQLPKTFPLLAAVMPLLDTQLFVQAPMSQLSVRANSTTKVEARQMISQAKASALRPALAVRNDNPVRQTPLAQRTKTRFTVIAKTPVRLPIAEKQETRIAAKSEQKPAQQRAALRIVANNPRADNPKADLAAPQRARAGAEDRKGFSVVKSDAGQRIVSHLRRPSVDTKTLPAQSPQIQSPRAQKPNITAPTVQTRDAVITPMAAKPITTQPIAAKPIEAATTKPASSLHTKPTDAVKETIQAGNRPAHEPSIQTAKPNSETTKSVAPTAPATAAASTSTPTPTPIIQNTAVRAADAGELIHPANPILPVAEDGTQKSTPVASAHVVSTQEASIQTNVDNQTSPRGGEQTATKPTVTEPTVAKSTVAESIVTESIAAKTTTAPPAETKIGSADSSQPAKAAEATPPIQPPPVPAAEPITPPPPAADKNLDNQKSIIVKYQEVAKDFGDRVSRGTQDLVQRVRQTTDNVITATAQNIAVGLSTIIPDTKNITAQINGSVEKAYKTAASAACAAACAIKLKAWCPFCNRPDLEKSNASMFAKMEAIRTPK